MMKKVCTMCGQEKELDDFYKQKGGKYGVYSRCKICKKEEKLAWYPNNLDKVRSQNRRWMINNREEYNRKHREKYNSDPYYKLYKNIRCMVGISIKRQCSTKQEKTENLLGDTIPNVKQYLENQFKPEMTWENHGIIWEIDHRIPISSFNLTNLEEQKRCFHYTNLQPLFKTNEIAESFGYKDYIGNRNKGDKI